MKQLFKTEKEAIEWVGMHISLAIKPKKVAKTTFVFPFSSLHAHDQVVEHLGKDLFQFQQEKSKNKNRSIKD